MKYAMRSCWLALTLLLHVPAVSAQVPADASACADLVRLQLPELAAIDAVWLPRGVTAEAPPAHCRVRGRIETAIRFELWLPAPADWSGRLLALGTRMPDGAISEQDLADALRSGYAVAATDAGQGAPGNDWLSDSARLRDVAYRAIYEVASKSDVIATTFFRQAPGYRYFQGCSIGGQQGLIQAARFPELFDGIVAGSPFTAFTAAQATELWASQTARSLQTARQAGAGPLDLLHSTAIARCDTLDGVADGVLEDPRRCNIDPARLACGIGGSGACLDTDQVAAAQALYAGPSAGLRNSSLAGAVVRTSPDASAVVLPVIDLPGFVPGSEQQWQFALQVEPAAAALAFFRLVTADTPGWTWRDFDLGRDYTLALDAAGWIIDTEPAALARYRNRGGKLLVYHGWNDANSPPEASTRYFDALGGAAGRDFARLFMVPGMGHCAGGSGTDSFDALRALEDWVERGIAPDRIEAAREENGAIVRTRPLCPYPQTARYRGSGDTDQSGSFVCSN